MDPRFRVFALVLALTIVFHQTLAKVPFGIGFSLFVIAYLVVFQLATGWHKKIQNPWAGLFLIPVPAGIFAESWYADPIVRWLVWLVVPLSLAFFSYWITSEARSWRDAFSLTPLQFFQETFLPFQRFREHFHLPAKVSGKHVTQVLIGLAVGFPLFWILTSLFAAADNTFRELYETVFDWNIFPTDIGVWVLDVLIGLFLLGLIGTAVRRRLSPPITDTVSATDEYPFQDQLALHTILVVLNAIFLVFVGIQILYVLQGSGHWLNTGLTYADYAKQSFYQLFWVGVLIFGVTFFCYRFTNIQTARTRSLLSTLILQTGVVLVSAGTRLFLYVSAYNLTVARVWGGIGLMVVGCLLAFSLICFWQQRTSIRFVQGLVLGSFLLATPLFLLNIEGRVAYYNIERFLKGETAKLDAAYLLDLSSDVSPALVTLADHTWKNEPNLQLHTHGRCLEAESEIVCLRRHLDLKRADLEARAAIDWRLLVRNDWRALHFLTKKESLSPDL